MVPAPRPVRRGRPFQVKVGFGSDRPVFGTGRPVFVIGRLGHGMGRLNLSLAVQTGHLETMLIMVPAMLSHISKFTDNVQMLK